MQKVIIILSFFIVVLGIMIGYILFNQSTPDKENNLEDYTFVDLGEYITNTQDNRYIKTNIFAETTEELNDKKEIIIKDKIIETLSSKTAEELLIPGGKEDLKKEIKGNINPVLKTKQILFNNFVIQ